jgi:hypothetical protein
MSDSLIVRILQRRGDLVEFAYALVATLCIVVYHLPDDITCELTQGRLSLWSNETRISLSDRGKPKKPRALQQFHH